jgi:hypothetical protein
MRKMGRTTSTQRAETIRPSKFNNGEDKMGTRASNVHGPIKSGYADGKQHRAALRDTRNDK